MILTCFQKLLQLIGNNTSISLRAYLSENDEFLMLTYELLTC